MLKRDRIAEFVESLDASRGAFFHPYRLEGIGSLGNS
jgi:hypothetical protein